MHVNLDAIRRGYELKAGIVSSSPPERLRPTLDPAAIRALRPSARLRAICAAKGWDIDQILSQSRRAPIVLARHAAINLWAEIFPEHSLSQIGRVFGRDHSTILHALGRIKKVCRK